MKVENIQLKRELKKVKRDLYAALKQLEDYKAQLLSLDGKISKSPHNEALLQELARLRQLIADKDDEIRALQEQAGAQEDSNQEVADLKDEISDLQQQLRGLENEVDAKQEEIEQLQEGQQSGSQKEVEDLQSALDNKEEELEQLKSRSTQNAAVQIQVADLRQQLKAKNEEISESAKAHEQALEQKQSRIQDLEEDKSDLEQDIRAKENELDEAKEQLDGMKQRLQDGDASNEDFQDLKDQLAVAEEDLENLRAESEQQKETFDAKIEELNQKQAEAIAPKEMQKVEEAVRQKEQELRSNRQELQLTQQRLSDKDVEVQRLLEQARSSASNVEIELRQEIEQRKVRIEQLEQDIRTLREDVHTYEESLRQADLDMERKLKEKDKQLEDKDDEVVFLEDKINNLEQEKRRSEEDMHGFQSELNRAHGDTHRAHDDAEARLREKEHQLSAKNEELRKLEEQLRNADREQSFATKDDELHGRLKEINELRAQLQEAARQAHEDLLEKDDEIKDLQDDLKDLQEELRGTNREQSFAAKNEELRDMQDEVNQLKRQLQDVEMQVVEEAEAKEDEMRLMEDDHKDALHRLEVSLREAQNQVKRSEEARVGWERRRSQLEADKLKADSRVTNLEFDLAQHHNRALSNDEKLLTARSDVQRKLQDALSQITQLRHQKQTAEDAQNAATDELRVLESDVAEVRAARNEMQQTIRDLRRQMAEQQRQAQHAQQTNAETHEADIALLEQELDAAQAKTRELTAKNESLTSSISRLKTQLAASETDLAAARSKRPPSASPVGSKAERRDLHEMLRDAKVHAEDLALQVRDGEARCTATARREEDLRKQLQKARSERADATRSADAAANDVARLQSAHDILSDELESQRRRASALAKSSTNAADAALSSALDASAARHARELRGLARQIEYLAARLRREEGFRRSLAFGKDFASRVLDAYARYHTLDLALVHDMGVPVAGVVADAHKRALGAGRVPRLAFRHTNLDVIGAPGTPGRLLTRAVDATPRSGRKTSSRRTVQSGSGFAIHEDADAGMLDEKMAVRDAREATRPTLRAVGFMVLAGVRMRRSAEAWSAVRKRHDALVRKLAGVRGQREDGEKAAGRKSVR